MNLESAESLIRKIRRFVSDDLAPVEREMFAMLLAPGVAAAYQDEVQGFDMEPGFPPLPEALCAALERADIRVVGLEEA